MKLHKCRVGFCRRTYQHVRCSDRSAANRQYNFLRWMWRRPKPQIQIGKSRLSYPKCKHCREAARTLAWPELDHDNGFSVMIHAATCWDILLEVASLEVQGSVLSGQSIPSLLNFVPAKLPMHSRRGDSRIKRCNRRRGRRDGMRWISGIQKYVIISELGLSLWFRSNGMGESLV
jgi:hypothetical protein